MKYNSRSASLNLREAGVGLMQAFCRFWGVRFEPASAGHYQVPSRSQGTEAFKHQEFISNSKV